MNALLDELATAGWAVLPGLLDDERLARARALAATSSAPGGAPFHVSNVHAPEASARRVDAWVRDLVGGAVSRVVPDQVAFLGALITKGSGGGVVDVHQDWTYTDERTARAVVVWIPLVDTDASSGALRVLEGSHLWTAGVRPGGGRLATEPHQPAFTRASRTLDLRAGDACVYDPALLHGSWPNDGSCARPAVAAAFAPSGAGLVHFDASEQELAGHRVDPTYFVRQPYGARPGTPPDVRPWADAVRPEDFLPHITREPQ